VSAWIEHLRRIFRFYGLLERKRLLLIFLGGALVSVPVIFNLLYPLVVRDIVDALAAKQLLTDKIVLLGGLYAASLILSYLGDLLYVRNKYLAAQEMRDLIFEASFKLPVKFFRTKGSGYFAKLIGDQVNNAFVVLDYAFMRNVFLIIRAVAILFLILSWDRILFLLFVANVVMVLSYSAIMDRATRPLVDEWFEVLRRITAYIVETLDNLHEVLAGRGERWRYTGYKTMSDKTTALAVRGEFRRISLENLLVELPMYLSRLVIIAYSAGLIIQGQMTIGTLWAVWTYFSYVVEPVEILKQFSRLALESSVNINSILDYFDQTVQAGKLYRVQSLQVDNSRPVIEVKDLQYRAGEEKVLAGVSFSLKRGDVLGIIGLSGEGKSTLLNILLGFEREYDGEVRLLGSQVRDIPPSVLFDHIAYYSQSVGIFNADLETNIVLGRTFDAKKLQQIVERLKLSALSGRPLGEGGSFVSGGEKHRIQLARLLYADKDIFILDEPLTNLDVLSARELFEQLAAYIQGKTGIIISHKFNVLRLAKIHAVLEQGAVVGIGKLDQLMRENETCRRLVLAYLEDAESVRHEVLSE